MKKIFVILLILSFAFSSSVVLAARKNLTSADQEIMITSTPPTSEMTVSGYYVVSGGLPVIEKNGNPKTFSDALNEFLMHMKGRITAIARKNGSKGACNLKISHSVTNDAYYFLATFDFYK